MHKLFFPIFALILPACSTLPTITHTQYTFPETEVYLGDVTAPHEVLGTVRAKVNYHSLDPNAEEDALCKNYYNKAMHELYDLAHQRGGDAVIHVKSVVFLEDGRREVYSTPECSDDGLEGQILAQGVAIKWIKPGSDSKDRTKN